MKHNIIKFFAMLLMATIVTACAVKPRVFNDADPQQDFGLYQTFSWASETPMLVQSDYIVSPFIGAKVKDSIRRELESKGYRFVDEKAQADMAVSFTIGARDKIKVFTEPGFVYEDWRWGRQYWEPRAIRTTTRTTAVNYVKGSLAIDVFDVNRNAPVWHGSASKRLSNEEKKGSEAGIAPAVREILANFPTR